MDAQPANWFARVVFSELLNPDVEELVDTNGDGKFDAGSLLNTQPVTVVCNGQPVAYDGFYDPSGNDVTQRPGPALFIQPTAGQVATGARCELTVNSNVTDKEGFAIDPNFAGPFLFGLAEMAVEQISPNDGTEGVGLTAEVTVSFNAVADLATLTDATLGLTDGNGVVVPVTRTVDGTSAILTPTAPLLPDTTYTVTVAAAGIKDAGGGVLSLPAPEIATFTTVPAPAPAALPLPVAGE